VKEFNKAELEEILKEFEGTTFEEPGLTR